MARIDQDITERATKHVQSVLLGPCPNVRFGSEADMIDCRKKRLLCSRKQTFSEATEIVSYVPLTDIPSNFLLARAIDDQALADDLATRPTSLFS